MNSEKARTAEEINETVAKKMGWKKEIWHVPGLKDQTLWKRGDAERPSVPAYSGHIGVAWELMDKMLNGCITKNIHGSWLCQWDRGGGHDNWICEVADTAPMAICLAYLKLNETLSIAEKESEP